MALGKKLHTLNKGFLSKEERYRKIGIDEIPVLLSNRGEIVCIPRESEVFSSAIIGSSGTGKTLLANRLMASLRLQWNANVSIMNDVSEETYKWSEPMNHRAFNEFNRLHLNQEPCPTPLVYFFPNTTTLNLATNKLLHKNYIKVVMPFADILDNLGFYLSGVLPEFELGKSETYINDLKEHLFECETPAQVKDVLIEYLPGKDGKSFKAMRVKLMAAFKALMKEEILDITNPECHATLKIKGKKEFVSNPFSAVMKAGGVPSFITSDLVNKKYKSEIFAYFVNQIFKNNITDFPGEKTFLFFDELRTICEKDDEPAAKAIGNVSARGRINHVGLVYVTQFYDKIPNSVKGAKLNYCFTFRHNSSKILNEVASDFDLDKQTKEKIKKLKQFEVIALTNNKFICYFDGERYETTKPIKGKIFFPFANHLKAGETYG